MILNLGQLCSRATEMAGGRSDWQFSDATFWVNIAYQEIASKPWIGHMPKEAIAVSSTTSGEATIALPTDMDFPIALTAFIPSNSTATSAVTSVVQLQQMDAQWLDGQDISSGEPEKYVVYGTAIELFPSPNSAYSLQLRYSTKVPTMVNSSDTPVLDERWHPAILYRTVALLEASRNNVEGEAIAQNRYLNYVASTPTDLQMKQRDKASMVLRYTRNKDRDT